MLRFLDDDNSVNMDVAVRLLAEVQKLPCDNCKRARCIDGEMIRHISKLKPGQLVKTRPMHHWWERYRGRACQVVSVDRESGAVELKFVNPLAWGTQLPC